MKDLGKIIQAISFAVCVMAAIMIGGGNNAQQGAGGALILVGLLAFGMGRFVASMGD